MTNTPKPDGRLGLVMLPIDREESDRLGLVFPTEWLAREPLFYVAKVARYSNREDHILVTADGDRIMGTGLVARSQCGHFEWGCWRRRRGGSYMMVDRGVMPSADAARGEIAMRLFEHRYKTRGAMLAF